MTDKILKSDMKIENALNQLWIMWGWAVFLKTLFMHLEIGDNQKLRHEVLFRLLTSPLSNAYVLTAESSATDIRIDSDIWIERTGSILKKAAISPTQINEFIEKYKQNINRNDKTPTEILEGAIDENPLPPIADSTIVEEYLLKLIINAGENNKIQDKSIIFSAYVINAIITYNGQARRILIMDYLKQHFPSQLTEYANKRLGNALRKMQNSGLLLKEGKYYRLIPLDISHQVKPIDSPAPTPPVTGRCELIKDISENPPRG